MSAVPFELIVAEDLDLGRGTVTRTMPAGGSAMGTKINLSTFQDNVGELFADLPSAAVGKGTLHHIRDSSVTTIGSPAAGGGASFVRVWSNGTTWVVDAA